ncbi:plastocyanin/azurin family copper-binding protein [Natrialbaceae archaeon A-CW3]
MVSPESDRWLGGMDTPDRRQLLRWAGVGLAALTSSRTVGAQDEDEAETEENGQDEEENGQETEEENGQEEDGDEEPATGESVTVDLVDYAYEPGTDSPLEIPPGTLVQFVWITDNHNIVVDDQPDEADWDGYDPIEDTGFEYEYTFETEGQYDFHCTPHIALGMVGTIVVDPEATVGDEDGVLPEIVPEPAITLLVATIVALLAVMTLVYLFLKYGSDPQG